MKNLSELTVQMTYSSTLSGKGALLDETLAVLREIDAGLSVPEVKTRVIDQDVLGKIATTTRASVWDHIHARYLGNEVHAATLARMVVHAPDRQTADLVLFYELCLALPLVRDTMLSCIYPRYAAGFSSVSKAQIQEFFDELAQHHGEINGWSPQTREKVASNLLTILRDFGLLTGSQQKQFSRLYVPLAALVYVLYSLAERGLRTAHEILAAADWQLFLLDRADVMDLLSEATAAGHCVFKHQADIYSLDLRYPSLEACVASLTGQV